jgi:hypothetical protein
VQLSQRPVPVESLTVDHPVERQVKVRRRHKKAAGIASVDLRYESPEAVYERRASVIVLPPSPRRVEVVERGEEYRLGNGILSARVAPGFMASMVSLRYRGQEYLNSSYPKGGQRGWRNPWHGGIHPAFGRLWGRLQRERFRPRLVERRGAQGLVWQGVRLTCKVAQESAHNHTLFIEYLMAPGVDVLAVVVGRRNTVGEWLEGGGIGFDLWSNLAEKPGDGYFHFGDDACATPKAAPHHYGGFDWKWGGLVSEDGRALFLGSTASRCRTWGWSEGPEGCVLSAAVTAEVPAGATVDGLFFAAPSRNLEEARSREPWSRLTQLP